MRALVANIPKLQEPAKAATTRWSRKNPIEHAVRCLTNQHVADPTSGRGTWFSTHISAVLDDQLVEASIDHRNITRRVRYAALD